MKNEKGRCAGTGPFFDEVGDAYLPAGGTATGAAGEAVCVGAGEGELTGPPPVPAGAPGIDCAGGGIPAGLSIAAGTALSGITVALFDEMIASDSEVSINIIADAVVTLDISVAVPRAPKIVWVEPPNAAPISAPLPVCNKTTRIMNIQTIT